MFQRLLIANRGEIACRIIRTAHRLGIECIAVYSQADVEALHVSMADQALCIGAAAANESYLNIDAIIEVAKQSGAEAIHPGYGFLSENPQLLQACKAAGLIFIGPAKTAMQAMASKREARMLMLQQSVPLIPGYEGEDTLPALQSAADTIGYPVLLKAVSGGGGRGMRRVDQPSALAAELESARSEALSAFGDGRMVLEKYLDQPRHIEVQILADQQGHCLHLHERDCSIQRRHQKVVEEAPAPGLDPATRAAITTAAVTAASSVQYCGAGTVEFLLDRQGKFYFLEMNTRLQVEHPVTEMITRIDLVEWQLRVAAGEALPWRQDQIPCLGHAVEARLYAEDPQRNFTPSSGHFDVLVFPEPDQHTRIDSGYRQGDTLGLFYDGMIAKLITHDQTRDQAWQRLRHCLQQTRVSGPANNRALLYALSQHASLRQGPVSTFFLEQQLETLAAARQPSTMDWVMAAVALLQDQQQTRAGYAVQGPWQAGDGWRLNLPHQQALEFIGPVKATVLAQKNLDGFVLTVAGEPIDVRWSGNESRLTVHTEYGTECFSWYLRNDDLKVWHRGLKTDFILDPGPAAEIASEAAGNGIRAPMTGRVMRVEVAADDVVEAGQVLIVLEAMKMEHSIRAQQAGQVDRVLVTPDDLVEDGDELVRLQIPDAQGEST